LDNRFEKWEAAPGLSQRRAFITADQMICFYNLKGVFLFKRVLAYLGEARQYFCRPILAILNVLKSRWW
jgi:hypothetical protein